MNRTTVDGIRRLAFHLLANSDRIPSLSQTLGTSSIKIYSNRSAALAWASRAHEGFMQIIETKNPRTSVELFAYYSSEISLEIERVRTVTVRVFLHRDGMLIRDPCLAKDERLIVDTYGRLHFVKNNMHLLFLSPNRADDIRHPARVSREILFDLAFPNGARIHGGASVFPSGAILVLGDKGAGKTTFLFSILGEEAAFCSNDRSMIFRDRGSLRVYGIPVSVRVGRGTVQANEKISKRLPSTEAAWRRLDYADLNATMSSWSTIDKIDLSVSEVKALFGCQVVNGARIVGIVVPEIQPGASGHHHERLSPNEKQAIMAKNLLVPDPAFPLYFEPEEPTLTTRKAAVLEELFALPWFRIAGDFQHVDMRGVLRCLFIDL